MPSISSARPLIAAAALSAERVGAKARAASSPAAASPSPEAPSSSFQSGGCPMRAQMGPSPCPALNIAWRRGLTAENGDVTKEVLTTALYNTFGTSRALGGFLAGAAQSNYGTAAGFNLKQLHDPKHFIEHRGSLVRPDADGADGTATGADRAPSRALFNQLASFSSDGVSLTRKELASAELTRVWQSAAPLRGHTIGLGEAGLLFETFKRAMPDGSKALLLSDLESIFMREELPAGFVAPSVGFPQVLGAAAQIAIAQTPFIGNARKAALAKLEETKNEAYPINRPANPRAEG